MTDEAAPTPSPQPSPARREGAGVVEMFDLCDRDGRPLGARKARPLVHRDGDWHRSFHCWVVTPPAHNPGIVLQRRSSLKETWPDLWDVSVAGHYSAGEGLEGGLREIQEELGLTVQQEQLVHVGWRRDDLVFENGLVEREVQDIFFLPRPFDLREVLTDASEVSGVALIPAHTLEHLVTGSVAAVLTPGGAVRANGRLDPGRIVIRSVDLVPRTGDYYRKVTRFALSLATGAADVRRRRWW